MWPMGFFVPEGGYGKLDIVQPLTVQEFGCVLNEKGWIFTKNHLFPYTNVICERPGLHREYASLLYAYAYTPIAKNPERNVHSV